MHTRALARCARLSFLFATSVVALASCAGGEEEAGPPLDSIPGVSRDANTNPPMLELDLDAQTFAGAGGGPVGGSGSGTGGGGGAGGTSSGGDAGPDGAVPVGGRLDASPPPPVATQCSNGQDDDGDGLVDAYDGDCSSAADPTEQGDRPPTGCGNGLDDDGDGAVDFPDDPGCLAVGDGDEADPEQTAECADGVDNDGNGRTDYPEDPGCPGRGTALEAPLPVPPACTNGVDDDEDGATDYPDDPDCAAAAAPTEGIAGECGDTHRVVDLNRALGDADFVDGDTSMGAVGFVGTCGGNAGPEIVFRYRVSGVVGALEFTTEYPETTAPTVVYVRPVCTDPRDVGCNRGSADAPGTHVRLDRPAEGTYYVVVDTSQADRSGAFRLGVLTVEAPRCSDTRDNDQDGRVDLLDPGCVDPTDEDEADPPCPARMWRRPGQRRRRSDRLSGRSDVHRRRRPARNRGELRPGTGRDRRRRRRGGRPRQHVDSGLELHRPLRRPRAGAGDRPRARRARHRHGADGEQRHGHRPARPQRLRRRGHGARL
jgi:hypothetical protein